MDEQLDPEELGTRKIIRAILVPREFAAFIFRIWLRTHRRRALRRAPR